MKSIYKKRLLKLAKHLRSKKLGHKKFDFSVINADRNGKEMTRNGCGFAGCAMGECPIAFPSQWKFKNGVAQLRSTKKKIFPYSTIYEAEKFFGLNNWESDHLFVPGNQYPFEHGGRHLRDKSKPESVAANIEAFVKRKEKE